MSFFSGLEGGLEKYIEGFFKGKNRGKIHLLDIAKKMVREMRDHRKVSINLVYVPNEYLVSLSTADWESIEHLTEAFSLELQDYLLQKAEEKGYTLAAHPKVRFSVDDKLGSGQINVIGKFGDTAVSINNEKADKSEFEETMNYQPVKDTAPVPVITSRLKYTLEVVGGPLAGKIFMLEDYSLVIGRRESCDIVLLDESVSRRHARLEYKKGSWYIHDLNSGNGTFINGKRVSATVLSLGDTIKLGATLCAFKVEL
ncbi:MAG: DUF3662 and FHA domain-containing protein [Peptococcaceae bacterium]|nr:DUF3662 and FHA domain-containing protein [Peptococcaceae bacterium]